MKRNQENIFIEKECDAWFDRNSSTIVEPVTANHNVVKALEFVDLPKSCNFIDIGGGVGAVSAAILKLHPEWSGTVLEPSKKALNHGKKTFPEINFISGSITQKKDMPNHVYDLVIISMVLTWIDRSLLTQAIANIDNLVKPDGMIIINDFFTPYPRANKYHHAEGVFTFKQDYSLIFSSTNLYNELFRKQGPVSHTIYDKNDPYDLWLMTSVLKKDLFNKYRQ